MKFLKLIVIGTIFAIADTVPQQNPNHEQRHIEKRFALRSNGADIGKFAETAASSNHDQEHTVHKRLALKSNARAFAEPGVNSNQEQKSIDQKKVMITFKSNGVDAEKPAKPAIEALPFKHREDKRKAMTIFLKSQDENVEPKKQREDKSKMTIFFKSQNKKAQTAAQKQSVQQDALLDVLRKRYQKKNDVFGFADKPQEIKSHIVAEQDHEHLVHEKRVIDPKGAFIFFKSNDQNKDQQAEAAPHQPKGFDKEKFAAFRKRFEAARKKYATARPHKVAKAVAQRGLPGFPRKKRDIAATVVGAAVSSVVSNLMKNVEESVVKANEQASKVTADVVDSSHGSILGSGEISLISNDAIQHQLAPQVVQAAPVSNEAVPKPFAPVNPIHADIEVIVGNTNATTITSTVAPIPPKKGFFSTLFGSFKNLFGTVTNSIGGFFIDMGSRITNFVEKRVKV
ncbi:uncharacterized protein CELE_M176.10 [Caenorhabditis elegans]|uniref:Uncharacterized protein n=1 Tax=Caenorhabditis elegans TaxID=6239 RepID=Q8WQD9_CAEEL|nr:Uncharacterized protein CELE_M176.10 [Caenorhabditis elegans]CAD21655.1 Uncharacterized protein CELE_M176.10 [Caenorhabditis elegans]|eukprot:NP_496014.1 Uncharacterized protein CELE_M176.10 [Caenorhabditis elegans]